MKRKVGTITKKYGWQIFSVAALLSLLAAPCAYATGTAAGTSISNTASISYSVSGQPQAAIGSSPTGNSTPGGGTPTTFLVDDKVDLTVNTVDTAPISVAPGGPSSGSYYVLTFVVTNTGNNTHDFVLSAANESIPTTISLGGSYTSDFNANSVSTYVDSNSVGSSAGYTATAWDGSASQTTVVSGLKPDQAITVYVVASIPATTKNNDVAILGLTAQVSNGTTAITTDDHASADDPTKVQLVFADSNGTDDAVHDGKYSSRDAYLVAASQLTVTKTSAVISDPIDNTTNPKAIPGAVIEYTVTIANDPTAGATASGVTLTDNLTTALAAGVAWNANSIKLSIDGGSATSLTDATGDDAGSYDSSTHIVTVNCGDIAANHHATVTYRVTVQ